MIEMYGLIKKGLNEMEMFLLTWRNSLDETHKLQQRSNDFSRHVFQVETHLLVLLSHLWQLQLIERMGHRTLIRVMILCISQRKINSEPLSVTYQMLWLRDEF